MRKHIYTILTLFLIAGATVSWAQERENDTIDTNVINVVKPYTPTISDAFKVKEEPSLDDDVTAAKKQIEYNIFSFPVASTFTPAKGKAAVVDKEEPAKLYDNYATLGFGSYTSILGEVYLNHALSRTESVSGYVTHHSSQGGIKDVALDDDFYDTKLQVNYSKSLRDLTWNVELGGLHQKYNWYGLPSAINTFVPLIAATNDLDVGHTFYGAHLGGDIAFEDTYIKSGRVFFRHFGDNNGSGENYFTASGTADIPIADQEISTTINIGYLGGKFDQNYQAANEVKYGNFSVGLSPSYRITQDDLTVNLGVSAYYLNDFENSDNKFYIYPNVTASYRIVDEILIAYGGIQGGLNQNTYYDLVQENPFVSPTLNILPTDQQYNGYVGLKGKVSNNVSYDIHGNYMAESDKALYKVNSLQVFSASENYHFGNSYGIVYDDVSTFSFGGALSVDVNRNFTLGLKADYFIYDVDSEAEAWNLPSIKGSLFADYQINKKWYAGASLFYVGEREASNALSGLFTPFIQQTVTLDGYFDANVNLGYHINDKLSVFLKGNNLANQDYMRWANYPVQTIQVLAGATYKFDF